MSELLRAAFEGYRQGGVDPDLTEDELHPIEDGFYAGVAVTLSAILAVSTTREYRDLIQALRTEVLAYGAEAKAKEGG